ncbi:prolyl hydroxylase family protein [Winogradskyella thalassocola]|uniref:2OG-Fe(II) oxygenase superfamily protein n=1 Tax=Winogradskyella thalassocola TaxID=262004 RepID=A0A1G7Z2S0_9FLAO|nr:2OG-Fe(II) oxygenase [Winogradskyella thalassocola]SDH03072.1 2OG-Fe(II) oxygenase superfamily protein [Winogradskyella thalassocola]
MSSKHSLFDLMIHSYYLTLKRFIEASGFKIARSSIRDALKKTDGIFDYSKLPDLLNSFFSDLLIFQIDSEIDNHEDIITPCLLVRTTENQTFIYAVLKIDKEKILIFEHDKKDYTISADEFQNLLKGAIIILKEEATYNPSKKLLEEYKKEQEKDKKYLKSIKIIDDFISEKDCKQIIDFYEENKSFQRSRVAGGSGTKVSDHRTSSSAMIETQQTIPIVSALKEKIAVLLGCNIDKIESLQCVRYYKFEEFKPHFDALVIKRKLTCLLYLNEGFLGGETYFSEVNFSVTPKVGRLLIFQNLNEDNSVIPQSYHQGSPILNGEKYACNIWIKN